MTSQSSVGLGRVEVVCTRCGGYGLTVFPERDPDSAEVGYVETCGNCGGSGHYPAEAWDGWRPQHGVLDMLAVYRKREPAQ